MVHMIIRKRGHGKVTVIVIRLVSHLDTLHATVGRGLFKVLGEQLALLVEVVAGSLFLSASVFHFLPDGKGGKRGTKNKKKEHTTSINASNRPDHFLISSVESCSLHLALSSPKYPLNAFWPHGQLLGFEIGANALTDLYFPGLRRNYGVVLSISSFATFYTGVR